MLQFSCIKENGLLIKRFPTKLNEFLMDDMQRPRKCLESPCLHFFIISIEKFPISN